MTNPLWNEKTFVGKIVAVMTVCFLAFIGLIVAAIVSSNRKGAEIGFMDDKFSVIVVYESDDKGAESITRECRKFIDEGKPDFTFDEDYGQRAVFKTAHVKLRPTVSYLQRTPSSFKGRPDLWQPIYAVIKGPSGADKLRRWAKEAGYQDWNFALRWSRPDEYTTTPVKFTGKDSEVTVVGFYENKGRRYMWDGEKVRDLSPGMTGNAGDKGEEHYRKYVAWLESMAK